MRKATKKRAATKKRKSKQPNPLMARKRRRPAGPQAWLPDEVKALRREYPKKPTRTVANELGRTFSSVQSKAQSLGLRKTRLARRASQKIAGRKAADTRMARGRSRRKTTRKSSRRRKR